MRSKCSPRSLSRFLFCFLFLAPGLSGCDRSSPRLAKADVLAGATKYSLRQTYDHLRNCCTRRAYWAMRPYIDSDHCEDAIGLLIAVDELLAANTGTQRAIRTACPTFPAEKLDLTLLSDNLDLFSRNVRLVDQQESGAQAVMRVQIADRVELTELRFENRNGYWMYMPGKSPADLVQIIREMTIALDRITLSLADAPKSPEEIGNEYRLRIGPKLKRISQLAGVTAP